MSHGNDYKNVIKATDYYPGGMLMPGRKYSSASTYNYGFNGKENDNDVKGEGNQQDYGMRIYDPRLVRFLSVDPITNDYPELTPYQFASNSPIANIDMDGKEAKYYNITILETFNGKGKLEKTTQITTYDKAKESGWHLHGYWPVYTPSGRLGEGNLYSISKFRLSLYTKGLPGLTLTKSAIYAPPQPESAKEHPESNFSFGIQVFGSGYDPDEAPSNKANSNMHVMTFNYKEFSEIIEPALLGLDLKSPTEAKLPTLDELINHSGERATGSALDMLDNKREQEANTKPPIIIQHKTIKGKWQYYNENGGITDGGNTTTKKLESHNSKTPDTLIKTYHTRTPNPAKKISK